MSTTKSKSASSSSSTASSSSSTSSSSTRATTSASQPSPFDQSALNDRLTALKLVRMSDTLVLDPNDDTKKAGVVFDERPNLSVEVVESFKTGFIEGAAYDGTTWNLQGGKPEKETQGSGAGAPVKNTYAFGLSSTAQSRWPREAGTYKMYFDIGTDGASAGKAVTVGVFRTVYRHPTEDDPDRITGQKHFQSRQDRGFVLGFDFDPMHQTFAVSFKLGDDGEAEADADNSTYVKITERLYREGPKAEPGSAYEVTDHTLGDGRVYLVFDVAAFDDVSKPVFITVNITPLSPSSKISSVYDYVHQVNAVDSGIGVSASPFEPAS